jgi:hypothetical protein
MLDAGFWMQGCKKDVDFFYPASNIQHLTQQRININKTAVLVTV